MDNLIFKPGLIVFPTAMISSTPLYCTICTKGLCEDECKTSQEKDRRNKYLTTLSRTRISRFGGFNSTMPTLL